LTVSCEGDESEAARLTWTPDVNTPSVVYYQVKPVCAAYTFVILKYLNNNKTLIAVADFASHVSAFLVK